MTPTPIQDLDDAQAHQRAREYLQRMYAATGLGEIVYGVIYVALGVYTIFNVATIMPVWIYYWMGGMVLRNIVVSRIDASRKANGLTLDRWPLRASELPHIRALNRGAKVLNWLSFAVFIALIVATYSSAVPVLKAYWYQLLIAMLVVKTIELLRRILTTHLWEYGFEIAGILGAGYCYGELNSGKGGLIEFVGIFICFGGGSLLSGFCLQARWSGWVNELERDEAGKERHDLPGASS